MTTPNIQRSEPIRSSIFNRFGFHTGSWTPRLTATVTDPTLGAGSEAEGQWMQLGQIMFVWGRFRFGTTTGTPAPDGGSGNYVLHLPTHVVDIHPDIFTAVGSVLGTAELGDNSSVTPNSRKAWVQLTDRGDINTAATAEMFIGDGTFNSVSNTSPFTWGARDRLAFFVSYPTDFLQEILES